MERMAIAVAKARFSAVLKDVEGGEEIVVTHGRDQRPVAVIVPFERWRKTRRRRLGGLAGWGEITLAADFALSDEELLGDA
jgi:prevent-host-death family protein